MEETLTIAELAERATGVLRDGARGANGRIREVPSERLIRWYTTIGLLDPPLTRRGRVARYGRRHLLQLVAVKRLQSAGLSIADIQARLTGATDAALAEVARLPEPPGGPPVADAEETPRSATHVPARERFWARGTGSQDLRDPLDATIPQPVTTAPGPALVHGVRLAPGVTVMLSGRAPTPFDLAVLGEAAVPLLDALRTLGLIDTAFDAAPEGST
ncbi:helix-turn-helix domain-containing protein [Sinosporangium siamense]|uniref:HTH merR-type domain-containing protein n=1 Tax=Sinosporangium siamense TaxID=1367973 RepID=A0A919V2S2_9ACTN|nr:helix-turn-helix domain-containing protein [Sinosporangium siamense]GII90225.1 hypothetical protein Ssi02_04560 [Sinosporangium siamense]